MELINYFKQLHVFIRKKMLVIESYLNYTGENTNNVCVRIFKYF